jgi:hypothetical protein
MVRLPATGRRLPATGRRLPATGRLPVMGSLRVTGPRLAAIPETPRRTRILLHRRPQGKAHLRPDLKRVHLRTSKPRHYSLGQPCTARVFAWEERSPALPTVCASMPPPFHYRCPNTVEQEVLGSVFSTGSPGACPCQINERPGARTSSLPSCCWWDRGGHAAGNGRAGRFRGDLITG